MEEEGLQTSSLETFKKFTVIINNLESIRLSFSSHKKNNGLLTKKVILNLKELHNLDLTKIKKDLKKLKNATKFSLSCDDIDDKVVSKQTNDLNKLFNSIKPTDHNGIGQKIKGILKEIPGYSVVIAEEEEKYSSFCISNKDIPKEYLWILMANSLEEDECKIL